MSEPSAAPDPEPVAHARPAVERWLTLTGLIPLPVFLVLHLSRELVLARATDVSHVLRAPPSPLVTVSSLLLVWLPLAAHALLGVWSLLSGRPTPYRAGPDVARPALGVSRVTSALALAFVLYHAREYPVAAWLGEADARDHGFRLLAQLSSTTWGVPLRAGAYLLGLLATVTHAGLAVHRALLREGLLPTEARRRRSARWCGAAAVSSFALGAAAVIRVASGAFLN